MTAIVGMSDWIKYRSECLGAVGEIGVKPRQRLMTTLAQCTLLFHPSLRLLFWVIKPQNLYKKHKLASISLLKPLL